MSIIFLFLRIKKNQAEIEKKMNKQRNKAKFVASQLELLDQFEIKKETVSSCQVCLLNTLHVDNCLLKHVMNLFSCEMNSWWKLNKIVKIFYKNCQMDNKSDVSLKHAVYLMKYSIKNSQLFQLQTVLQLLHHLIQTRNQLLFLNFMAVKVIEAVMSLWFV